MNTLQSKSFLLLLCSEYDEDAVYHDLFEFAFNDYELSISRNLQFPSDIGPIIDISNNKDPDDKDWDGIYDGEWIFSYEKKQFLLIESVKNIKLNDMLNLLSNVLYEKNTQPITGLYKHNDMYIIDVR
jgi:hypothetical protein